MKYLFIFSDGSCSWTKGVGCYALMEDLVSKKDEKGKEILPLNFILSHTHKSTEMEFVTILSALDHAVQSKKFDAIILYTDCARFVQYATFEIYLPRKQIAGGIDIDTDKRLKEHFSKLKITVVKVKGHKKKSLMTTREQEIFGVVDKEARQRLRSSI